MATTTTNLGLTKPATSDNVDITVINGNMDIIDAKMGPAGSTPLQTQVLNILNGLAITANGDTHAAISSGQYVYVRNHSSLSEGLYVATQAISTNVALTESNVSSVGIGGLNSLLANKVNKSNMLDGYYAYRSIEAMQDGIMQIASGLAVTAAKMIFLYPNFITDVFPGGPGPAIICNGESHNYFSVLWWTYSANRGVVIGSYNVNEGWNWCNTGAKPMPLNSVISLNSNISTDSFYVYRKGKHVIINGGITSKTSSPVSFSAGDSLILSGLPTPVGPVLFMGETFTSDADSRKLYRLCINGNRMYAYNDTVIVPPAGSSLYVNISYFAA